MNRGYQEPLSTVPRRLRMAMAIRNMSQADLSRASRIPQCTISEYMRGLYKPGAEQLIRLARALGVSADFLLGLSDKLEVRRK